MPYISTNPSQTVTKIAIFYIVVVREMRGYENTVEVEEVVLPFKLTSEGVCRFLAKQSLRSCCLTGVRHYPAPRPRASPGAPGAQ